MKKIAIASALLASMLLAACQDERPSPGPSTYPDGNYVEAAPYPDGTQK